MGWKEFSDKYLIWILLCIPLSIIEIINFITHPNISYVLSPSLGLGQLGIHSLGAVWIFLIGLFVIKQIGFTEENFQLRNKKLIISVLIIFLALSGILYSFSIANLSEGQWGISILITTLNLTPLWIFIFVALFYYLYLFYKSQNVGPIKKGAIIAMLIFIISPSLARFYLRLLFLNNILMALLIGALIGLVVEKIKSQK